jgi:hypothetical protein
MVIEPIVARLLLAIAVAMLMLGAVTAWTSANFVKRVAGILVASLGALTGAAALSAPVSLIVVGVAAAFAQLLFGVALGVRLQEGYGGVEAAEFDAADDANEPAEPRT